MTDDKTDEPKKEEEKEEPKEEAKKEEKPKPSVAAHDAKAVSAKKAKEGKEPSKKLTGKIKDIAKEIEGLTALELADLAGYLEEKFGVSAMPVAQAGAPAGGEAGAGDQPAEEKSSYTVALAEAGANKLAVIKAVREFRQDLGLMDAKKLVESAPKDVLVDAKKEDAEAAKKKLEDAGAKVQLK